MYKNSCIGITYILLLNKLQYIPIGEAYAPFDLSNLDKNGAKPPVLRSGDLRSHVTIDVFCTERGDFPISTTIHQTTALWFGGSILSIIGIPKGRSILVDCTM